MYLITRIIMAYPITGAIVSLAIKSFIGLVGSAIKFIIELELRNIKIVIV